MPFTFQSADGKRSQGVFATERDIEDAQSDREFKLLLRRTLGKNYRVHYFDTPMRRVAHVGFKGYSTSFGQKIHDSSHHRDLQQEHGTQDYEPSSESKERLAHGMAKSKRDR